MSDKTIMFYMNNPCVIIREVSEEFAEIKLNPKFAHSVEASQYCMGCMLGPMDGAYPSHSCEQAEEIIDSINDEEAAIIVMVERRLLHDKPVEEIKYTELQKKIFEEEQRLKAMYDIHRELSVDAKKLEKISEENQKKIHAYEEILVNIENKVEEKKEKLDKVRKKYFKQIEISSKKGEISVSGDELAELYKSSFILSKLQSGGVDNWQWFDESMPTQKEIYEYVSSNMGV